MKTEFTVDKEFILQAHKEACSEWKTKLEDKFPGFFETKIQIGNWYTHPFGWLACKSKSKYDYGFRINGSWDDSLRIINPKNWKPATKEEVEKALIKEAKKRGFVEGVKFKCLHSGGIRKIEDKLFFLDGDGYLNVDTGLSFSVVFYNGKWAKPLENETLKRISEIEYELEQLKKSL